MSVLKIGPKVRARGWHWQPCRVVKDGQRCARLSFNFLLLYNFFFRSSIDTIFFPYPFGEFVYNLTFFFFACLCYCPLRHTHTHKKIVWNLPTDIQYNTERICLEKEKKISFPVSWSVKEEQKGWKHYTRKRKRKKNLSSCKPQIRIVYDLSGCLLRRCRT